MLWPSYQVCKLALLLMQLEESKTLGLEGPLALVIGLVDQVVLQVAQEGVLMVAVVVVHLVV